MKLSVKNLAGQNEDEMELPFILVEDGRGTQAVHDVIVAHRAAARSGTACAKTRAEVNGTRKKPYRQKGTGMARAGSFQSPIWVGGGVVFGPRPRDYRKKVNRSTRQLALRKALSERIKAGDLVVVTELKVEAPRTKEFIAQLERCGLGGVPTLVVVGEMDRTLQLASRNVPGVELTTGTMVHPYQVLRYAKLLFTRSALEQVGQRLAD
jgi:large subunit ribosomal protein L4